MAQYRKKPVVIDAEQWHPGKSIEGVYEIESGKIDGFSGISNTQSNPIGVVLTLEGHMIASPGDWIITGVKGEKYPCKPDIFEESYEIVVDETYKQKLREAHYPHRIIKDWDEDKCEAEWSALGENRMS